EDGNPLGVQWTQFRFAAAPPTGEDDVKKTEWQTQQIYMAHSAVTTTDKHYADEKWSRAQASLAGVDTSPFRVYLDDWQWTSSTTDLFPATLKANSEQFGYSLTLTSSAPYQKQGEQGYSTKSADGQVASYYYSQPFIDVSGQVTIDGETHQVSGKGWIDREWSSQFLLDSQQGW
ncbi:carotenoid 1,2-hydratase, partial [Cutibacterium acnes]